MLYCSFKKVLVFMGNINDVREIPFGLWVLD
jgi:hypothetical protein